MAKLVSAYLIYNAATNEYIDNGQVVTLNCEQLQAFTPIPVYIQRSLAPGDGTTVTYQLSFDVTSADQLGYGTNLVQGYYVEQDGQGMVIDIANIQTLISSCNACCDDTPAVTLARFYTEGIPLFSNPSDATFCITRTDDGSVTAHQQTAFDYEGQYFGNVRLVSNISGVSRYSVQSFTGWPPVAQGTDVVATGTC